ncbi:RNA polymerase II C-terminal domain kinase beta subunit [Dimargaris verticillata]|uniref:RNA polymerase II C-terminal domain kinase beta subunit n=1 Tax=Dimargaris verticillata TaxID=2761393 RepID=A0A9W8EBZ7_9FUNG|nr:RNA polymerase II C-terminal domain kinase beta subunit [Dimargaris verticillata]
MQRTSSHSTAAARRALAWATDLPDYAIIKTVGQKMGFPMQTICTAQLLLTRFYLKCPETLDFTRMEVNLACLFVACKAEETIKKLRDILLAAYILVHPNKDELSVDEQVILQARTHVIRCEAILLEIIHFSFEFPHPHQYTIKFAKCLQVDMDLAARAWKITTECFETNLPLRFPPHTIAVGSLYLASKLTGLALGEQFNEGRPWFVKLGSRLEDIDEFSNHMIDFYIASSRTPNSLPSNRSMFKG